MNKLLSLIDPYFSSYHTASLYILKIQEKICQVCIVFEPFESKETYTELLVEPTTNTQIFVIRIKSNDVFNLLQQFDSNGFFKLEETPEWFAYSVNDLSTIQILDRQNVSMFGRDWSCWSINSQCSQSLDKFLPTFDFNILYKILREEKGYGNLSEAMTKLSGQSNFVVDSNVAPGIMVFCPIWARVKRCGVVNNNIRICLQTSIELSKSEQLYLNVLTYPKNSQPSARKITLGEMQQATGKNSGDTPSTSYQ